MASTWCLMLAWQATSTTEASSSAVMPIYAALRSAHSVPGDAVVEIQSTTTPITANSKASYMAMAADRPAMAAT